MISILPFWSPFEVAASGWAGTSALERRVAVLREGVRLLLHGLGLGLDLGLLEVEGPH
ncbi:hypothetical protein [Streptomyces atratus]|uniref:hypothetical protein n=1 Tax=Streptomyces atratus TaxID=1893 RepID=UPI0032530745